jgi:hypothetical protein
MSLAAKSRGANAGHNAFAMLDRLGGANSKTEARTMRINAEEELKEAEGNAEAAWTTLSEKHGMLMKMMVRRSPRGASTSDHHSSGPHRNQVGLFVVDGKVLLASSACE